MNAGRRKDVSCTELPKLYYHIIIVLYTSPGPHTHRNRGMYSMRICVYNMRIYCRLLYLIGWVGRGGHW